MAAYSWKPKAVEMEYVHPYSIYYKTGMRRNQYHINPEWVSEEMHPMGPLGLRRYRPWAFEFQGARLYPWGSREKRWAEEKAAREIVEEEMEIPAERNPVTEEERYYENTRVPIYVQDTRPPWGREPARPQTTSGANYSRHFSSEAPPTSHLNDTLSRSATTRQAVGQTLFQNVSDENRVPYDPIMYKGPYAEVHRQRAAMIAQCAEFQPKSKRPRFDRPYMNFANSMWMKYPPDIMF